MTGVHENPLSVTRPAQGSLAWLRMRAIARRHAYVMIRSPHRLFDVSLWPLVDVLLFGSLGVYFSRQSSVGPAGVGFLLAGILLFHVVFQAEISLSTAFMEETWSRNLLNLLVTPLTEVEYVAGVVLFGLAKLAIGVGTVALRVVAGQVAPRPHEASGAAAGRAR